MTARVRLLQTDSVSADAELEAPTDSVLVAGPAAADSTEWRAEASTAAVVPLAAGAADGASGLAVAALGLAVVALALALYNAWRLRSSRRDAGDLRREVSDLRRRVSDPSSLASRTARLPTPTPSVARPPDAPEAPPAEPPPASSAPRPDPRPSPGAAARVDREAARRFYAAWCQSSQRPEAPAGLDVSPLRFVAVDGEGGQARAVFEDARSTSPLVRLAPSGARQAWVWPHPEANYDVRVRHAFPDLTQAEYAGSRSAFSQRPPIEATRRDDGAWTFSDRSSPR